MKEFIEQRESQLNGGNNDGEVQALLYSIRDEINGILDAKSSKTNVLALLEAYRLYSGTANEKNTDHAIRICQAIIADAFGYKSRADWSEDIRAANLIDYGYNADFKEQYRRLTDIVRNIKI